MREKILKLALFLKEKLEIRYKKNNVEHRLPNNFLYLEVNDIIKHIDDFDHIMRKNEIGIYSVKQFDSGLPEDDELRSAGCKLDFWLERLRRNEVLKASKDIVN